MKGELAATIIFMGHWCYYLQYRSFILRIDNRALLWIKTMETPSGMIQRVLETLANFDFTTQHRPGTQYGNADSLSRVSHSDKPDKTVCIDDADTDILTIGLGPMEMDHLRQNLIDAYKRDPILSHMVSLKRDPKATTTDMTNISLKYRSLLPSLRVDKHG